MSESCFSFQRLFLSPFETILTKCKDPTVKELIVNCIGNIVLARVSNIKSGWKTLFACFALAANDRQQEVWQPAPTLKATNKRFRSRNDRFYVTAGLALTSTLDLSAEALPLPIGISDHRPVRFTSVAMLSTMPGSLPIGAVRV